MSAIFGIIKKSSGAIEPDDVVRLQQAIAHRDTDGRGLWQSDNVALGFSKLTIFPQQIGEQLPVETSDMVLTADIHLHNREELYQLLDLDKNQWHNESDSILLLKAYQLWGEHCVDKLEGEFAFAIWNKVSRRLFIATDQIGFRPVFYYDGPDEFIFCSELKGVEAAKTTPNYFNEEHLIEYYFRKSDPAQTYNKEIFALCGGNTLVIADNEMTTRKYWTLEAKGKYHFTTDDEWIACTRDLLYRAIEKRLNPGVPTGVTLSGGLDSSSVACILADLLAKKNKSLYAFSSVLPVNHTGIERDERKFIEIINQRCPNIIQTYVEAPGLSPFDGAEEAFKLDEALPNSFFYIDSALLHAAGNKGVRSLFSGFGGRLFYIISREVYYLHADSAR